ncbi:MAG: type IV secretion system DNA-binding domain-containing protein [Candidatus Competibacteraceae bacterium]|nr:type IV secretion system DNA-binding domain-containing protein [Candidatus Competibacteraceae bacterium]
MAERGWKMLRRRSNPLPSQAAGRNAAGPAVAMPPVEPPAVATPPVAMPPVEPPAVAMPPVEPPRRFAPPLLIQGGEKTAPAPLPSRLPSSSPTVPDQLLIGARSNGEPVYWHYGHPQLANRHLLIFGATGVGKTYGVQCLLAEMAQQHLRSIIIDYTDGFLPSQIEPLFSQTAKPQDYFIRDQLPLNPFRRQQQVIDPSQPAFEETPYQIATRIASIFTSVFNTMGDQQSSTLIRVLETGIQDDPQLTLDEVLARLRDDKPYGETLASKLEPLIRSQPFRPGVADSAWEEMLHSPERRVHVLQLKGLAREIQRLVTEFVLWDLYDYACNTGSKNSPIPVVLDEIQNLDHRSDSPIDKMLREGRKFGLSLILATQTTSQFNQEARDRLFQAGHKLFFKPADTEIERFAQLLSQSTGLSKGEWGERLARLEKGQCWSFGPVLTSSGGLQEKPVLASVTPLEQRHLEG